MPQLVADIMFNRINTMVYCLFARKIYSDFIYVVLAEMHKDYAFLVLVMT